MTLTKKDLIEKLMIKNDLTKKQATNFVESFFEKLSLTLEVGEEISISGFGKFNLLDKKARPGRNPKTMEEKIIEPRRVTTFNASGKLLKSINGEAQSMS